MNTSIVIGRSHALILSMSVTLLGLTAFVSPSAIAGTQSRISRAPILARFNGPVGPAGPSRPAPLQTDNFIVYADDALLAKKVAQEAERYRKELAIEWLGKELPPWNQKCPIRAIPARDAGGATTFGFAGPPGQKATPVEWEMEIFGPPDRMLDAVLPHEITHTIFATHFGQPLPRWADEGACTTVEHVSEREKNHQMLIRFLSGSPSRGIPFNRMFTMTEYPEDILPLYAQGYSLAKFLIFQKGRRSFLDYVASGLQYQTQQAKLDAWTRATNEHYGFESLSDLQLAWVDWVKKGSRQEDAAAYSRTEAGVADQLQVADAVMEPRSRNLDRMNASRQTAPGRVQSLLRSPEAVAQDQTESNDSVGSWYTQQMNRTRDSTPSQAALPVAERSAYRARSIELLDDKTSHNRTSRLPQTFTNSRFR